MRISRRLEDLWRQLQDEGLLEEMTGVLQQEYFRRFQQSNDPLELARLHAKTQMVNEMLTEFSTIIDFNRETER